MGTRSLTFVYEDGVGSEPIINMYRQFDGYISGHGVQLSKFLMSGRFVNGIPVGDNSVMFNGMEDLACQLVANFKKGNGGFYLYPVSSLDCGQEYEYHVYRDRVIVKEVNFRLELFVDIFDGSFQQFWEFCYQDEVA